MVFLKQQENLIGNICTMECDKELPYTHAHNKIELLYSIYLIPHYYRIVEICNQK